MNLELFLWEGPESKVDAVIRKRSPLRKGWWFRSYIHPEREGWVQLYKVGENSNAPGGSLHQRNRIRV